MKPTKHPTPEKTCRVCGETHRRPRVHTCSEACHDRLTYKYQPKGPVKRLTPEERATRGTYYYNRHVAKNPNYLPRRNELRNARRKTPEGAAKFLAEKRRAYTGKALAKAQVAINAGLT